VSSLYWFCLNAGSTVVNILSHLGVTIPCHSSCSHLWYKNHSSWNSCASLLTGFCIYWLENACGFIPSFSLLIALIGKRYPSSGSHCFLSIIPYLVSYVSSLSAIAGILNTSRFSLPSFILFIKKPLKSSSCVLCCTIIIQSLSGLNKRDGTVFENRLFTPSLITALLSASSGLIGSSIKKMFALLPVIVPPVPVA